MEKTYTAKANSKSKELAVLSWVAKREHTSVSEVLTKLGFDAIEKKNGSVAIFDYGNVLERDVKYTYGKQKASDDYGSIVKRTVSHDTVQRLQEYLSENGRGIETSQDRKEYAGLIKKTLSCYESDNLLAQVNAHELFHALSDKLHARTLLSEIYELEELCDNMIKEGLVDADEKETIAKYWVNERYLGSNDRKNIYLQNRRAAYASQENLQQIIPDIQAKSSTVLIEAGADVSKPVKYRLKALGQALVKSVRESLGADAGIRLSPSETKQAFAELNLAKPKDRAAAISNAAKGLLSSRLVLEYTDANGDKKSISHKIGDLITAAKAISSVYSYYNEYAKSVRDGAEVTSKVGQFVRLEFTRKSAQSYIS